MQLARAVRNRTTGVLYVLDEPSIGLHPSNIEGLTDVMHDLIADGNSVVLVDHDTQILKEADWLIEMGPEAGAKGGHVIAQGTIPQIEMKIGILDQSAILLARRGALTKIDCATRQHASIFPDAAMPNWTILLAFSGIKQPLTSTAYNMRVDECRSAAKLLLFVHLAKPYATFL